MKSIRERKFERRRNKARRNLEKLLVHYAHNDLVIHLQVTSYCNKFCKDSHGEVHPDIYIENYMERVKQYDSR